MFKTLMASRRFAPLFWCQFGSAFNCNFLKNSLIFLILARLKGVHQETLITLAGAVLVFPFFILSSIGGEIADRFDKARVAERLKLIEIAIAALAVSGFWLQSIPLLFFALLLFGVIEALFSPTKYGILPDHLARSELPTGNALIDGATFIAILAGMVLSGLTTDDELPKASFASVMIVVALANWTTSRAIPPTGNAAPDLKIDFRIVRSTFRLLGSLKAEPRLWWGGVVGTWFWTLGTIVLSLLPPLVEILVGGGQLAVTAFFAIFAISVGVGAGLASWLARGRIVLFQTPIAAALMALFALDIGWVTWDLAPAGSLTLAEVFTSARGLHLAVDFAGLAISGGLFIVPVSAAVLAWAGSDRRARVVAAVNVLNAAGMTAVSVAVAMMQRAGITLSTLFLAIGLANVLVAIAVARTRPDRAAQ